MSASPNGPAPTRTATVQIGPFSAPLGPLSATLVQRFLEDADANGWLTIAVPEDGGIVISAVRIEPVRTVRQRVKPPAVAGTGG